MADINLTGTLPPEILQEQQQLNRRQQMAQLLMQQGFQQPQGQMVSGRYVAPSIFQNIAPLLQTYLGSRMAEKGDKQAVELARQIREGRNAAEQKISDLAFGTPDMPTEMAGPYGMSGSGQNVPMPVAIQPGRKPDIASALREINTNQFGAGKELKPLILKQMMPEATPEERRFKAAVADGSWNVQKQGGLNAFLNQMSEKDKASLAIDRARLNIAQQELAYNTGIGMPNMGGNQGGGQVNMGGQGGGQFVPQTIPQYQYNPSLSPKQNQEAAGRFAEKQQSNVTNAKDSFDLMQAASSILSTGAPSSGFLSNAVTAAGEAFNLPFGARKQESQADAQLKMLSGALTMKQPRFEGPQGVLDVTLYQKLAGDLGNANIPVESRLATMKQMVDLQKKYYPGGDWDSISTTLKDSGKVSVGKPSFVYDPKTGTFK
jgi:hypothetical protein